MADQPGKPTVQDSLDLEAAIDRVRESLAEMDQALEITFQTFADKGIKPTFHLPHAQLKVRNRLSDARQAARRIAAQLERLNGLIRITALITSTLETNQVLEDVMDTVITLTGAERAYLMVYNDARQLEIRAARNWDQESLSDSDIGLSRSVVNAVIESGEPIITTNAQADERFSGQASIVMQKLRSIVCVPLTLAGKVVGVLYADNRLQQAVFSQDLIPVLTAFGTQAAIAITNAHMFGRVKEELAHAQHVIQQLQIEIDRERVDAQVTQITESGYFQELAEAAKELRRRRKSEQQQSNQPQNE